MAVTTEPIQERSRRIRMTMRKHDGEENTLGAGRHIYLLSGGRAVGILGGHLRSSDIQSTNASTSYTYDNSNRVYEEYARGRPRTVRYAHRIMTTGPYPVSARPEYPVCQ